MAKVIAKERGYFGGIVREPGETFSVPAEIWDDERRRPSWVDPVGKVEETVTSEPQGGDGPVNLEDMTVKDLRAYAKDAGIPLPADVKAKADIIAVLSDESTPEPQGDGEPAPDHVRATSEVTDQAGGPAPDWVPQGQNI